MRMVLFSAVLALVVTSGACDGEPSPEPNGPTSISADDYDRSCTTDDNCVLVVDGDVCGLCRCDNSAIRQTAHGDYSAGFDDIGSNCAPPPDDAVCGACYEAEPRCINGQCEYFNLSDPSQNDFGDAGVVDAGASG